MEQDLVKIIELMQEYPLAIQMSMLCVVMDYVADNAGMTGAELAQNLIPLLKQVNDELPFEL